MTVLHVVAQTERISLAEFLIAAGADINAKEKYSNFTPLDFAQDGEPEMIELLVEKGGICSSC
jgi:ankyrin repeat protein